MECAIQLRDPFAFERLCSQIESLHNRLEWMYHCACLKSNGKNDNQYTKSDIENLNCCSKLRESMVSEDYKVCELEHNHLKNHHYQKFFRNGKNEMDDVEISISKTEAEMRKAIKGRNFDLCSELNTKLGKLHKFRSLLHDDETKHFSINTSTTSTAQEVSMSENAAPNEELEMLREELSSTRRYARNLHNDRHILRSQDLRYPRFH